MTTTDTLGLKKPAGNDYYNIEDANYNSDKIDAYAESVNGSITQMTERTTQLSNGKADGAGITIYYSNQDNLMHISYDDGEE